MIRGGSGTTRPPTRHLFSEPGRIRVTFTWFGYSRISDIKLKKLGWRERLNGTRENKYTNVQKFILITYLVYLVFFTRSPRNSTLSTLEEDIHSLCFVKVSPSLENTLSAWVDVAGMQRYFLTSWIRVGYCNLLALHHSIGSKSSSSLGSFL